MAVNTLVDVYDNGRQHCWRYANRWVVCSHLATWGCLSEGTQGRGLVQCHRSLYEALEFELCPLPYAHSPCKSTFKFVTFVLLFQPRHRSLVPLPYNHSPRRSPNTKHCMLLSRSSRGLSKTLPKTHLPNPKSTGLLPALLHSLHFQVRGSPDFPGQHNHIYRTLLSRRLSSSRHRFDFSESSCTSITVGRRSITTMAAADRSILPDTYVLSSMARFFH